MSEAIPHALGECAEGIPLVYLSGPSFAKEMVKGHPMAVVVASKEMKVAEYVQKTLSSILFRCYASDDVIGVEVGGALKNPLAIGAVTGTHEQFSRFFWSYWAVGRERLSMKMFWWSGYGSRAWLWSEHDCWTCHKG
eukprot:1356960-Amorphochlora_amoeboformis.AAC.3